MAFAGHASRPGRTSALAVIELRTLDNSIFATRSNLMKHTLRVVAIMAVVLLTFGLSSVVSAHEKRTIAGGKYDVKVGWKNEPTVINQPNGATIEIKKAGTQDAVTGVEKTLQVKIALGGKELTTLPLVPLGDTPGTYVADFTPPATGSYVWTFIGTIEGNTINEEFDSGPGRFDDAITAEEAAKVTPFNDDDATSSATENAASAATEAAFVPLATSTTPIAAPQAPSGDMTALAATVGIVVILLVGAVVLFGRKPKP